MVFESVRGYVELASGLTELTRARALEAAHGLLSLPAAGIATGSKVAVQAGALADELMAAAAANRSNLTTLVRSEVDVAFTRLGLGLVPAQKLHEAQAEVARLRAEVARLRSSSPQAASKSTAKKAAAPRTAKKAAGARSTAKKAAAPRTAKEAAVTTRVNLAGA
jgi:G:T/U-mismatch repair DNA glycosylase